jgi:hypothetical protein
MNFCISTAGQTICLRSKEYLRIKRKIEAKSQAIHSLKKQQANVPG